mmetsp:Transcript_19893/g.76272  ORF Transcript_19893/g.76272 Transcript_19893/m.76272 type:complete len:214 (-) Transcript_19893:2853-3494(-)
MQGRRVRSTCSAQLPIPRLRRQSQGRRHQLRPLLGLRRTSCPKMGRGTGQHSQKTQKEKLRPQSSLLLRVQMLLLQQILLLRRVQLAPLLQLLLLLLLLLLLGRLLPRPPCVLLLLPLLKRRLLPRPSRIQPLHHRLLRQRLLLQRLGPRRLESLLFGARRQDLPRLGSRLVVGFATQPHTDTSRRQTSSQGGEPRPAPFHARWKSPRISPFG